MSTPSKPAGKKRALSGDEAPYHAPSSGRHYREPVQTPSRPTKKRHAAHVPPTPTTSAEPSTARQRRGSSSRPELPVFRLSTPLSPSTPSRGGERAISISLSVARMNDEFEEISESDVDSQATISLIDDINDSPVIAEQSTQMPANASVSNVPGFTTINQNKVVNTGGQPAPAALMQFRCAYPQGCTQTQDLITESRTCISHHFGRNKKQTRIIMFPRWCRMHYQQTSYKPVKGENRKRAWGKYKVSLVQNVVDIIERQQPGVRFQLKLKRSENDRLNAFKRDKKVPDKKSNTYQSPISILQEFDKSFEGEHRTRAKVLQLLDWALKKLNDGEVDDCPSFEILPEWSAESYVMYAHVPKLNGELKRKAEKIKPPKKLAKKQQKKRAKTIPAPTAIPTKVGKEAPTINEALPEDRNESEDELSESETGHWTLQSPTPMDVGMEEASEDGDDADDEAENPDLPVPPRVRELLAARRLSQKGSVSKPAKK